MPTVGVLALARRSDIRIVLAHRRHTVNLVRVNPKRFYLVARHPSLLGDEPGFLKIPVNSLFADCHVLGGNADNLYFPVMRDNPHFDTNERRIELLLDIDRRDTIDGVYRRNDAVNGLLDKLLR